jgi:hypothetical protein
MEEVMDPTTPLIVGALLALFTAIQTWINKGRFDAVDRQLDRMRADITSLRAEIGSVRSDLSAEIGSVRSDLSAEIGAVRSNLSAEIGAVRSDLFQVVLRLAPEAGPQTG